MAQFPHCFETKKVTPWNWVSLQLVLRYRNRLRINSGHVFTISDYPQSISHRRDFLVTCETASATVVLSLSKSLFISFRDEVAWKPASTRRLATLAAIATLAQPLPDAFARRHIGFMALVKASRSEAARTALTQVPKGKIKFTELELAHGRLLWCFDISMGKTKNVTEVEIDARTGQIVSSEVQTPEDHLKDEAAETAGRRTRVIYRCR